MLLEAPPDAASRAVPAPGAPHGAPGTDATAGATWAFRASLVLAVLPVVVATARAVDRGWLPVGDNAYFAIRARDVLTEHHPLLGTWTSASISAGTNFNNPGPLLFDLLAAPAKLVSGGAGVAIGAALLNVLAILGIGLVARRRGGPLVGALALLVTSALTWTLGSELLFDPWQPHSLLLTSLLLLLLVWSVASGDVVLLPLAVGVASLVVQTHLSYAVIVVALGLWAAAGLVVALRRARREGDTWASDRRRAVRAAAVAGLVLAACWAQPVVEQVAGEGEGNLSRLAANAGGSPDTVGPALGVRIVASVVTSPPGLARPSFQRGLRPSEVGAETASGVRLPDLPPNGAAGASLAVLALVLAGCAVGARRRGHRAAVLAAGTAAVALAAGLVTASSLPLGFSGIAPHQFRWLWPVTAFTALAVLSGVAAVVATSPRRRSAATVATALGVLVLVVVNLPSHNVEAGPSDDAWAIPVVRELGERMEALEGEGPLLIDMRGIRFAEPYSGPVMAELQRRGIPFVVEDEGMVRQLGPSRRAEPGTTHLRIREGDATQVVPPGERRAVLVEGLDEAEQAELEDVRDDVLELLGGLGRVPLNERGEAALARGDLAVAAARPVVLTTDHEALLATRELDFLVAHDLLDLDPAAARLFGRYAVLQRAWDVETVALFLVPADGPAA